MDELAQFFSEKMSFFNYLQIRETENNLEMIMKLVNLIVSLSLLSTTVFAFDLKGSEHAGILVDNKNDLIKYTFCYDVNNSSTCRPLGPKVWYKKEDLESLQSKYYWKTIGNGAGAIGAGIGTIFLGFLTAAGGTVLTAGGTVAAAAGAVSMGSDFLNTNEIAGTALGNDALNDIDQNLKLDNKEMTRLALRLEKALLSID